VVGIAPVFHRPGETFLVITLPRLIDASMTVEDTLIDPGEVTLRLRGMGIEDGAVECSRTLTMRPAPLAMAEPIDIIPRLPRLLREGGEDTMPELRIKGVLGEGGMGVVQLAEQLSLRRDVAVKKARAEGPSSQALLSLLREGWTTGLLEHPNIVPIYTLGRDEDGQPVIVMKKIEGTSWADVIRDPSLAPQAFKEDDPLDMHVEILSQVCNAMDYAHNRGIIHRDLKPDNIMLGEFGEVYVLDWGIAVSLGDDRSGRLACVGDVTSPAGTPVYMAPEMVDGRGERLGIHSDVYLLGAMLHEALTGRPPHSGRTVFQILIHAHMAEPPIFDASVPEELAAICRKALSREPEARFGNARGLREALSDYRRTKESRRLTLRADGGVKELEALLLREARGEGLDETLVYRTLGGCRFAYEQALEIWPENRRAADGLQRALEAMAVRELDRQVYQSAALLIADLPHPNPGLSRRLADLADELASRQRDYEALQRIKFDVDVEVGRTSRMVFALVMGVIWGVLSFGFAIAIESGRAPLTHSGSVAHMVLLILILGGVMYGGRVRFFENELNRKVIYSVMVVFACALVLRSLSWIHDLPVRTSMTYEFLLYGTGSAYGALTLDRRIGWTALPFMTAAIVGSLFPALVFWAIATANVVALGVIIVLWWPAAR
jgi:eukaryotic-like serine/threonine-protein kinase